MFGILNSVRLLLGSANPITFCPRSSTSTPQLSAPNFGDPNVPIHSQESDGTLELNKGYHKIKILIHDAKGNIRIVRGTLFYMNPFQIDVSKVKESSSAISFLLQPKSIAIPIKSAVVYSFTAFGFADEGLKILSQERIETGLIVTLKKDKVKRRALQFIAQNDIGTISNPAHWLDSKISGDHLTFDVDLDISQSDGGVYIQIQTEKVIDKKLSLRIKGDLQYKTIPINQIQPSVFLSAPLQPKEFESINQINAPKFSSLLTLIWNPIINTFKNFGLYRLECSIRSTVILGLFGIGGIGTSIFLSFQTLNFRELWTYLWSLALLIIISGLIFKKIKFRKPNY